MKDKVLKIILIISFIPYVLQILCIATVEFQKANGGHFDEAIAAGFMFLFLKPISMVCFIYEIAYIVEYLVKNLKKKKDKKEFEKVVAVNDDSKN